MVAVEPGLDRQKPRHLLACFRYLTAKIFELALERDLFA
jgi:hypothetical protein